MRARRTHLPLATILLLAALASRAAAQAPAGESFQSLLRAHEVVQHGIAALGGTAALSGVRNLTLERSRTLWLRAQDPGLAGEPRTATGTLHTVIDIRRRRVSERARTDFGESGEGHTLAVSDAGAGIGFTANLAWGGAGSLTRAAREAVLASWLERQRSLPHLALLQAAAGAATLRHYGEGTVDGRPHHRVGYADERGTVVTLYLDAETHLLTQLETVGSHPWLGDVVNTVRFAQYESVDGVRIPRRWLHTQNDVVVQDVRTLRVAVNGGFEESVFEVPEGQTEARTAEQPEVEQVADGLYLANLNPNYRSLFIEMGDHVVVVEAPFTSAAGERLIDLVERTVSRKPIRYVIPTHYHGDHIGGLRPFIAAGITILTTPGTAELIRELAAGSRVLSPDPLSRAPREPVFEMIAGQRTLGGGDRTLEVFDIGSTSHSDEAVIAYLPAHRILFQGDLFIVYDAGGRRRLLAGESVRNLAHALDRLGLDVERVLGVHGLPASREDLRTASAAPGAWFLEDER